MATSKVTSHFEKKLNSDIYQLHIIHMKKRVIKPTGPSIMDKTQVHCGKDAERSQT